MRTRLRPRARTLTATVTAAALAAVVLGVVDATAPVLAPPAEAETADAEGTVVPPARIESHAATDPTWAQAVLGDTLYGIGFGPTDDTGYLERWTSTGWVRDPSVKSAAISAAVAYDGAIYYLARVPSTSTRGSALWRYDGVSAPTRIATFGPFTELTETDSGVFVTESTPGTQTQSIHRYDGSTAAPVTLLTTSKDLTGLAGLGDEVYLWAVDENDEGEVYRLDGTQLTRIGDSPFVQSAVEWNGALHFGGGQYVGNRLDIGVYRFDGTTTSETAVNDDVDFTRSSWYPTVGVYDGDLAIIDDAAEDALTLYLHDGESTTRVGSVTDGADSPNNLVEHHGVLFASMYDDPEDTWLFDKNAVRGQAMISSTPTITGTKAVGQRLTAAPGGWTPTAVLAYQWSRNGSPIDGATKPFHTLTADDRGATITVTVTGTQIGLTGTARTSAATPAVAPGTIRLAPVVSGTMKAGSTIKVVVRGLTLPSAALGYRWYRDGKPLAGATKSSYRVMSGDVGRKLTVKVSARATGYTTASVAAPSRTGLRK